MAFISDDKFKIEIRPIQFGPIGWEFYVYFYYEDKPLFNPEITEGRFYADEQYFVVRHGLLDFLEEVENCKEDNILMGWNAWEDTVRIEVFTYMKNLENDMDGLFDFTIFVGREFFKDGEQFPGFFNPALRLSVDRQQIKDLIKDLRREMFQIAPDRPTSEELEREKQTLEILKKSVK